MQPELHVDCNIYTGPFTRFERPKIIGYIDIENLKFAKVIPKRDVSYDLNLLIDQAKHRPDDLDVKITELLKFLLKHETRLQFPTVNTLDNAQFFCYRGLMTCVACTPYENREPWKIVALLFKGNIYLCARDTEEKIQRKRNMSEREKQCTSWGYKFEQFLLSDTPDSKPNPNLPVDEMEEFSLVLKTKLGNHSIVYGAEMDGIICENDTMAKPPVENGPEAIIEYLSSKRFIELKTSRHIETQNQERNFRRFKTKKWWCQSFLVGIDTIVCGFRNDNGIVEELKTYTIKELPKGSERFWKPNVCFNFLDTFFTYVKRCLGRKIRSRYGESSLKNLQRLPLISILFEWNPGMPIRVNENYSHDDDPILHQWFIENYGKNLR